MQIPFHDMDVFREFGVSQVSAAKNLLNTLCRTPSYAVIILVGQAQLYLSEFLL